VEAPTIVEVDEPGDEKLLRARRIRRVARIATQTMPSDGARPGVKKELQATPRFGVVLVGPAKRPRTLIPIRAEAHLVAVDAVDRADPCSRVASSRRLTQRKTHNDSAE
jgi:hypothetical protein